MRRWIVTRPGKLEYKVLFIRILDAERLFSLGSDLLSLFNRPISTRRVIDSLTEQNRHEEESKHIIQEMRDKADQAVSGLAVQDRKKDRIYQDAAQIPRNDPRRTCDKMRSGKEYSTDCSQRPERKMLHALSHKERAEFDLLPEHCNRLIEQQQRKLIQTRHIDPPEYMIDIGAAKHRLAQKHLCRSQNKHEKDQWNHARLLQVRKESLKTKT